MKLIALLSREGDHIRLGSPTVGLWRERPPAGSLITAGSHLGRIELLGVLHPLVAPDGAYGVVIEGPGSDRARHRVDYGAQLMMLDPSGAGGHELVQAQADQSAVDEGALLFRSPMSGRFYSRPSPDEDAFVKEGEAVSAGQTLCLLEVMKTFNRVVYAGSGLPQSASIKRMLVADGDDVEEGQPLFELTP